MKKINIAIAAASLLALGSSMQAQADGAAVYNSKCMSCHASGAAGAPKVGDVAAWVPRLEAGMDTVVANAINGKGAMPPKGACMDCSDADITAAVEYMVNNSK